MPTNLQAHFIFLQRTMQQQKKNKKSLQANASDTASICANLRRHSNGRTEARTDNSTYPKGGVYYFADTFVQAESSVHRIKFCGKNPALLVAAKRQAVKKLHFSISN